MGKCGICGGEVPKRPCITDDGRCDACHRELILKETPERAQGKKKSPDDFG